MRSNQIAWNPMEAFSFTVANEDHNLYTFDIRQMKTAQRHHEGHVSAVYVLIDRGDRAKFILKDVGRLFTYWKGVC